MKKEKRISYTEGILMVAVAGLYDAGSVVPFLNIVIIPIAWLTFRFWFHQRGVSIGFGSPKRILTTGFGALIEFIPAISALPAWVANGRRGNPRLPIQRR